MRTILVVGATGQIGSAFLRTATRSPSSSNKFRYLAMTRDTSSTKAQELAKLSSNVQIVQGDLDEPKTLRKVFEDAGGKGSVWGVFSVLAFPGWHVSADGEEKQGKLVVDIAAEYGIEQYVYSSTCGLTFLPEEKLRSSHLAKLRIERHIESLGASKGLQWTILRPGVFMENFIGPFGTATGATYQFGVKKSTKILFVTVNDIGRVANGVFENPSEFAGKQLLVISDQLTADELERSYLAGAGKQMPHLPPDEAVKMLENNKFLSAMAKENDFFWETVASDLATFEGRLAQTKKACPEMTSLETWARSL